MILWYYDQNYLALDLLISGVKTDAAYGHLRNDRTDTSESPASVHGQRTIHRLQRQKGSFTALSELSHRVKSSKLVWYQQ